MSRTESASGRGICPACGAPNACGLATTPATGGGCWCLELPPVMPMPPAGSGARCYCRQCLADMIEPRLTANPPDVPTTR